jgi:hypothetical protein
MSVNQVVCLPRRETPFTLIHWRMLRGATAL